MVMKMEVNGSSPGGVECLSTCLSFKSNSSTLVCLCLKCSNKYQLKFIAAAEIFFFQSRFRIKSITNFCCLHGLKSLCSNKIQ